MVNLRIHDALFSTSKRPRQTFPGLERSLCSSHSIDIMEARISQEERVHSGIKMSRKAEK